LGEIVRVGDSVLVNLNFGWDVGLSNNSARAVVADALQQNGLALTQYDNSQVGFFGGAASLTVLLQSSDYSDKQDVADAVAGIIQNQLGLSVSGAFAVSVTKGSPFSVDAGPGSYVPMRSPTTPPLTVDAGPGSYVPMRSPSESIPTIDAGVILQMDIPIPPEDWLDKLARQLGISRSMIEIAGIGLLVLGVVVIARR
jgi:hypothetical protein